MSFYSVFNKIIKNPVDDLTRSYNTKYFYFEKILHLLIHFTLTVFGRNKIGENQGSIHFHMATLLETGRYSDLKFTINNRTFFLHKCILTARSEYFREKFKGRWKNKNAVYKINEEVQDCVLHFFIDFNLLCNLR